MLAEPRHPKARPVDDAQLDEALRALSHPARRAIIRMTVEREVPASELADALGIAPATASEHLKVLRKTGLVRLTADGTWRRYRAILSVSKRSGSPSSSSFHLPLRRPREHGERPARAF